MTKPEGPPTSREYLTEVPATVLTNVEQLLELAREAATAEGIRAVNVVRRLLDDHFALAPKQEAVPSLWRRLLGVRCQAPPR